MKYGMILSTNKIADQITAAQLAETYNFDSVWLTEFFHQHGLVRMAAVAGATQRVTIGSAIAYAFMRSPILAANGAMDIDEISHGRTILGLGSGTKTMNEKWYSIPFDSPPAPRMQEAVELIRATFAAQGGGGLKFEGEHYNINIPQFVRPGAARESIPVYVAGVNIGMIRCAARVADGLVGHPVYTRGYIKEVVLPELEDSPCALAPYVICAISDNVEQARNEARAQIAFYYSTPLYHSILDVHGWREQGAIIADAFRQGDFKAMTAAVTDEMIDQIAITGTPEEARQQMQQWEGLTQTPLLYTPSIGMSPERSIENHALIAQTFST
jgi:probable F420-dependent oxidoreductase